MQNRTHSYATRHFARDIFFFFFYSSSEAPEMCIRDVFRISGNDMGLDGIDRRIVAVSLGVSKTDNRYTK